MYAIVVLLLATPLARVTAQGTASDTTSALQALVERAAVANQRVPDGLQGYRAMIESEMAFVAVRADAVEQTLAVEQTVSTARWDRDGTYEQHVVGYRSQSIGLTLPAIGLFREAWTVPVLYGNRISLLFGVDSGRPRTRRRSARPTVAVHPFAVDRARYYRFSGGQTVTRMNPGGREIEVVRVHVEPWIDGGTARVTLFRGDIDLDGARAEIVRMRGYFVSVDPHRGTIPRLLDSQLKTVAFIELENGEFDQRYWLPVRQRIEAQASVSLFGDQRAVFRIISRFRNHAVRVRATFAEHDSLGVKPHRLTFAPSDSIDRYGEWTQEPGALTGNVGATDFADVAPDPWRGTGTPLLRARVQTGADLFHYNRIEGAYTGLGIEAKLRDRAPGVVMRGTMGWAWAERTIRGRASVARELGAWQPMVRMGRSLDLTNDFREPFDSGSTLGALVSVDDYDYVDRHVVAGRLTWRPRASIPVRVVIEGGMASDRYAVTRRDRGPLARGDSGFRMNRGVDAGRYRFLRATATLHPDVDAAFLRPGLGATVSAEAAGGDLAWQRVELRLVARRTVGPVIYAMRLDAGVVGGDSIPPQQLFELGESQNLPGYGYKEFAGNQATVARTLAMLPLPFLRGPLRFGRWVLPAIGPALSAGVQSGWAAASTTAARAAIRRLGTTGDAATDRPGSRDGAPLSRPTDGIRTSVDVRLRFFGGAFSIGVARATDRHDDWRLVIGLGQVP